MLRVKCLRLLESCSNALDSKSADNKSAAFAEQQPTASAQRRKRELRKGGEDVMAKQKVWMPSYVYTYYPWYGYYAYPAWQEYEVVY